MLIHLSCRILKRPHSVFNFQSPKPCSPIYALNPLFAVKYSREHGLKCFLHLRHIMRANQFSTHRAPAVHHPVANTRGCRLSGQRRVARGALTAKMKCVSCGFSAVLFVQFSIIAAITAATAIPQPIRWAIAIAIATMDMIIGTTDDCGCCHMAFGCLCVGAAHFSC